MQRRDISLGLLVAGAGSAYVKRAQAQSCVAPCYAQTAAESAAGVTPTYTQYPPGNALRYGADPSGSTDSTSALGKWILVGKQAAATYAGTNAGGIELYIPAGAYTVTVPKTGSGLNFTSSTGGTGLNDGLRVRGDGLNSTVINFVASTAGYGVGIDLTGAAYLQFEGIRFNFGGGSATAPTNYPNIGILQGAANVSGFVFSGSYSFDNCLIAGYGSYTIYDCGAEQITYRDTHIYALSNSSICALCISSANSAGITSPNTTLNSPAASMTCVEFTGFRGALISNGQYAVYYDLGTTGVGSQSFVNSYILLGAAAGIAFFANGGSGAKFSSFNALNIKVESNNTTRNLQVMRVVAATITGVTLTGSCGAGSAVTGIPFSFSTTVTGAFINWNPNDAVSGFSGAHVIEITGNYDGIAMSNQTAAVTLSATGGNFIVIGTDTVEQGKLTLMAAAPTVASGQLGLGSTTSASASAGGVAALPATVSGYLIANLGGTEVKIPYFAN